MQGTSEGPLYMPYGASGGGGAGGTYVFTDLAHLDSVIARWTSIRDRIRVNTRDILQAIGAVVAPADDDASTKQANRLIESLEAARQHNDAVLAYAIGYVEKLTACRAEYVATETNNTDHLTTVDEAR